jgi:PAS domain S-box-containing protein
MAASRPVSQTEPRAGVLSDAKTLRSLIEQVPVAVYIDRLDDISSNVFMSPHLEAVLGYSAEEWASDRELFVKVVHPDDRERVLAEHRRTAATGDMFSMEYRMVARDGSVHWFLDEARVIRDETGQPMFHHGFILEITERKKLEEALRDGEADLRRQKEYYESLLALIPTAIVTFDLDDRVTSWNPAAERLFGYVPEEAMGRDVDELVAASDEVRGEALEVDDQVAAGSEVRISTRRTRKDGTLVDVDIRAAPIYVGGEMVAGGAIYHDISELLQARRAAEAATETKSAFLATMSHEIRTPLNAVIGMTQLLLATNLTSEQQELADVIRTSGETLLVIINDILDFSKIEAGKLELERRPFVVRECVESALDIVAAAAAAKGLELAGLVDPQTPAAIVGDAARLRQVVVNLLTNAVKFTDRGEVVLRVGIADSTGVDELEFAVADTGIGIPTERMGDLFASFTQVDASTTRRYGGTGLGLAISKRLTELMGGRMWAESEVGKGSTFHLAVPIERAPYASPARDDADVLRGKRILVVDDNAANREVVKRHALSWGMVPRDAHSAREALELVRGGERYDVAVLDMQMPELDGVTLAHEIHAQLGGNAFPLLLLTSLGSGSGDDGSGAVFAGRLTKPLKASQLYEALVAVLGAGAAPATAAAGPTPQPPSEEPPRQALRILVAEDNAINERLVLLLLQKLGYGAEVARTGVEAVEAVRTRPYDVVLMDVEMPDLDGLEATRRIRAEPQHRQAPTIIAVTANAMQGDRDACLAAGMDEFLTKPIRLEELDAALARCELRDADAVDPAALEQVRAVGGPELAAELTEMFLAETPTLIAALRRACGKDDADELRRGAHTLKAHGRTFGAAALADACGRLEGLAAAGVPEDAEQLVDQIEHEFGRAAEALRR